MPPSETVRAARDLVDKLENLFMDHAHPENAPPMQSYMKGKFPFFGIKSPERKALSHQFLRDNEPIELPVLAALFRECFSAEERELQYFVQDAGRSLMRKLDMAFLPVFHDLIGRKSWWDTVDFLSPKLAGMLLRRYPERVADFPDQWIESGNFWYQRSAILFQLHRAEIVLIHNIAVCDLESLRLQKIPRPHDERHTIINPDKLSLSRAFGIDFLFPGH